MFNVQYSIFNIQCKYPGLFRILAQAFARANPELLYFRHTFQHTGRPDGTVFYIHFITGLALRAASGVTNRACLAPPLKLRRHADGTFSQISWWLLWHFRVTIRSSTLSVDAVIWRLHAGFGLGLWWAEDLLGGCRPVGGTPKRSQ